MARLTIWRGDFIVVALSGDYGKPRPALVVQSNVFTALPSVTFCPLTGILGSHAGLLRIPVEPSPVNGVRQPSHIVIDKIMTVPVAKIGRVIGRADNALMVKVNQALALFLDIV